MHIGLGRDTQGQTCGGAGPGEDDEQEPFCSHDEL